MSIEFIFRLIGMVLFGILGVYVGERIANLSDPNNLLYYQILVGLVGALAGLVLTPFLTTRPVKALRVILGRVSVQTLLGGLLGLLAGLISAALLAFPLSLLPEPFGNILPFIGALIMGYLGVMVFIMRQNEIFSLFRFNLPAKSSAEPPPAESSRTILLDTSVIIDGRIADIARTGFLMGSLLIPRFILNELQFIADSPDSLRRQRGRRGMEVLAQL
ncbi:MAG: PIN domain nuclease, partial [Anaerolineales bacterium]